MLDAINALDETCQARNQIRPLLAGTLVNSSAESNLNCNQASNSGSPTRILREFLKLIVIQLDKSIFVSSLTAAAQLATWVLLPALILTGCGQSVVSRNAPGDHGLNPFSAEELFAANKSIQSSQRKVIAVVTPLPDGENAFDVWLSTLASAKRTIDIKTFIFSNDEAGELVAAQLIRAANKGVRVRLLVDGFFYYWGNTDLTLLDQHKLIDVQIFNPLSRYIPPPFNFLLEFDRVNARMHNKVVVVDEETAIIGGRNVGDEYFLLNPDEYFVDFDMVVTGAPVGELQASFDAFWQDRFSVAYSKIAKVNKTLALGSNEKTINSTNFERNVRQLLRKASGSAKKTNKYPDFRVSAVTEVDLPSKLRASARDRSYTVANSVLQSISNANSSVLIVTPYFIPENYGAELLETLVRRGVDVEIFTNSLGSTNHPSAHAGYLRYRSRLLKAGVKIYELRENLVAPFHDGQTRRFPMVTMHTKLTLIDDRYAVVGSLNLDPRSIRRNSETALLLDSADLAKWLKARVEKTVQRSAYELRLNNDLKIDWNYEEAENQSVRKSEPSGGFVNGAVSALFGFLPFDSLL